MEREGGEKRQTDREKTNRQTDTDTDRQTDRHRDTERRRHIRTVCVQTRNLRFSAWFSAMIPFLTIIAFAST